MLDAEPITHLIDDFEILEDWEDRYRYVIELGKKLPPLDEALKTDFTKVTGCVSQVWLICDRSDGPPLKLSFRGMSDAHIVQGLIAILFSLFNGKTPQEIMAIDEQAIFHRLGLDEHLTPQRSNGLAAMVKRIRADAARMAEAG